MTVLALLLALAGGLPQSPLPAVRHAQPTPAPPHARLEESTPADGDTVRGPLPGFRLRFSAPVDAGLSRLRLVGPGGDTTALVLLDLPDSAAVLRAEAPPLRPGPHRLLWRTVSADGHPVQGSIRFEAETEEAPPDTDGSDGPDAEEAVPVGGTGDRARPADAAAKRTAATGSDGSPPPLRRTLLAGLGLACLLAAAGLLWFTGGTDLVREPRVLRATTATALGAVLLLTLALLDWLVATIPPDAGRMDGVLAALGTRTGATGAMRIGLALLVFLLVGGAHAGRLSAMLAMTAVVLGSAAGHPASIEPSVAIGANALHVGAAAFWIGGVLLLALLPDRSELAGPDWSYAEVAQRVSARAFLAVGIIVGTAVVQDLLFLDALPQLWETAYGRLLLAKGAGLGLLVGFGAWHRWRTLPRLAADGNAGPLRRAVRIEIWVLVAVVLLAAWLSRVPPPAAG